MTELEEYIVKQAIGVLDSYLKQEGISLTSPDRVREFLRLNLESREQEVFAVLFLDNQNRLISFRELFFGTIDSASIYPREVVKVALELNAAVIICAHNHPSGVAEASQADIRITLRLKSALELIDVRILDHFIVGAGEVCSMAERGLI